MHSSYDKLLFFSFSKVLSLYEILTAPEFSVDKMIQEVGFLFENDSKAIKKLRTAVKVSIYTYSRMNKYVSMYMYVCD